MNDKPYLAMTVAEFCERYRIDRATYYRNAKLGRMPPAIKVGGGTRILTEDEQAWLAKQRGATAQVINQ
jgi:excisionase family DNA binding protein